jgi:hypothetical protein
MATAVVVNGTSVWSSKGVHKTTWSGFEVNTTGDVGSIQNSYGSLGVLSIIVTGTMTSDVNIQFQESIGATETFTVAQTVCGTAANFDSTTGSLLATGTVYQIRPGGTHFRPKITAGASTSEDLNVIFVQSKG